MMMSSLSPKCQFCTEVPVLKMFPLFYILHWWPLTSLLDSIPGRRISHWRHTQPRQNNNLIYLRSIYPKPAPCASDRTLVPPFAKLPLSRHSCPGVDTWLCLLHLSLFTAGCSQFQTTHSLHLAWGVIPPSSISIVQILCTENATSLTCNRLPLTVLGTTPQLLNIYTICLFPPLCIKSMQWRPPFLPISLSCQVPTTSHPTPHHGWFAASQRPWGAYVWWVCLCTQPLLSASPSSIWSKWLHSVLVWLPPAAPHSCKLFLGLGFPIMTLVPPGPPHRPIPAAVTSSFTNLSYFRTTRASSLPTHSLTTHASVRSMPFFSLCVLLSPPESPPYPPDAVSDSLLTPLTSFPLASAPQSDPNFRLSNATFRFPFSRKLCLPVLLEIPHPKLPTLHLWDMPGPILGSLLCLCPSLQDSSKQLHPQCHLGHLSLHHIPSWGHWFNPWCPLRTSTPLSYIPLSWLADVGLQLSPAYLSDPYVCPLNFLAIDVSVISVPSVLLDPTKNAVSALQSHITAEAKKFTNCNTKHTVGQVLIHELTSQAIAILPFTIDPHGGLGPFATSLLFRLLPTTSAPTLPPAAQAAYKLSSRPSCVSAILAKADSKWRSPYPSRLFGQSFCTPTPSSWAKQLLGLNFTTASSRHFYTVQAKHHITN